MARVNGPIKVYNPADTVPTDAEGGYAGGDSTAAAVAAAGASATAAGITDATTVGRDVLKATNAAAARGVIGAVSTSDARLTDARPWAMSTKVPAAANLNTYLTPGAYPVEGWSIANSLTPRLPVIASGILEVLTLGLIRKQVWTTTAAPSQMWLRSTDGSGVWGPWRRLDGDVRSATVSVSRSTGTAYTANTVANYHYRQPVRVAQAPDRFRVTLRNVEERTGTAYTATINGTGLWIGPATTDGAGELTGQFASAPTQIVGAFTVPTDGSTYTSPWIESSTYALTPGLPYLISFGYTGPGGQPHTRSRGYIWGNADSTDAPKVPTSFSLTGSLFAPLVTNLEVQGNLRRVAMVGDSHTAANNARLPVHQSPLHLWAQQAGFTPVNMGLPGSSLTEWLDPAAIKWTAYGPVEVAVCWLGQNDIFGGTDSLATLQVNYLTVLGTMRSLLSRRVLAATIMPRNGTVDPAREAIRVQFNDWLMTLPAGIAGVVDVAAAVTDPATGKIRAALVDADNTHLNTAGCNVAARAFAGSAT